MQVEAWQVDPKAEMLYGLSPYNSMNNNPVALSDPEGDIAPLLLFGIGAASGILGNGISNSLNGQPFFKGAVGAAFFGGWSAAGSFAIGGMFGGSAGIGTEFLRAGAHGAFGGITSLGQGGNFGSGFFSGGISSGMGSSLSFLGNEGSILSSTLGGGLGAGISGGEFWQGAVTGMAVGMFNHAIHSLGQGDPPWIERLIAEQNAKALGVPYDEYIKQTNPLINLTLSDVAEGLVWAFDLLNGGPSGEGLAFSAMLRGGKGLFIKGLGYVDKEIFHRAIKPHILSNSGNYIKAVGNNPSIFVQKGRIFLKGTGGGNKGKIFDTGLKSTDFF